MAHCGTIAQRAFVWRPFFCGHYTAANDRLASIVLKCLRTSANKIVAFKVTLVLQYRKQTDSFARKTKAHSALVLKKRLHASSIILNAAAFVAVKIATFLAETAPHYILTIL